MREWRQWQIDQTLNWMKSRLETSLSVSLQRKLGRSKQHSAFEHAQNVQIHIILRMRKVSSGPLLSFDEFYSIKLFWKRTAKGPDRTAGRAFWSGLSLSTQAPKAYFCLARLNYIVLTASEDKRRSVEFKEAYSLTVLSSYFTEISSVGYSSLW